MGFFTSSWKCSKPVTASPWRGFEPQELWNTTWMSLPEKYINHRIQLAKGDMDVNYLLQGSRNVSLDRQELWSFKLGSSWTEKSPDFQYVSHGYPWIASVLFSKAHGQSQGCCLLRFKWPCLPSYEKIEGANGGWKKSCTTKRRVKPYR